MADETSADANSTVTEVKAAEPVSEKLRARIARKKAASVTPDHSASVSNKIANKSAKRGKNTVAVVEAANQPIGSKRKKYTPAQRTSILASVEKIIKDGTTTLKAALQQLEMSEQTYYNWKNAAGQTPSYPSTKMAGDDLASLVALEAENLKLRKELAEKLRAENAELRKRLGKA